MTSAQPITMEEAEIRVGSKVAFIFNKNEPCPGVVTLDHGDGTFDMEVMVPSETRSAQVSANKVTRESKWSLQKRLFPRVRQVDPRAVFRRVAEEIKNPVFDSETGRPGQTVTDRWEKQPRLNRIPRLIDMQISLVGMFFDPSKWNYQLRCFKKSYKTTTMSGLQVIPEETKVFPSVKKGGIYTSFEDAFKKYFKERYKRQPEGEYQAWGYWTEIEIVAVEKPAHAEEV